MSPLEIPLAEHLGPLLGSIPFILLMSLIPEPRRREFNAIFVAGAAGVYVSGGGFGPWEVPFLLVFAFIAYKGLKSYKWIGTAWIMHSCWDIVHHFYGNPIWPFMSTSSWGCMIFDAAIAIWFFSGAPSFYEIVRRRLATK